MAYSKYRKGGSGGKLGHSNMSHWDKTEEIKKHSKKTRRLEEREIIRSANTEEDQQSELYQNYEAQNRRQKRTSSKGKQNEVHNALRKEEVDAIIQVLSKDRTKFYYFKDYYAFLLLSYFICNEKPISEIHRARYYRLLQKPIIQRALSNLGKSTVTKEMLFSLMPPPQECYLLTLDRWGSGPKSLAHYLIDYQTSRGGYNLVLQLNFSNKHNRSYNKLIRVC